MASTSGSRGDGATSRIRTASQVLYSEHQTLVAEMKKALSVMKDIAVDLERDNEQAKVKDIENCVVELLESCEECVYHASAIESVGNSYQPGPELTDFRKLIEDELAQCKASSSFAPQNHLLMRQFREAVWYVHHAGQPMPGEEQEDIVMTNTQSNILNKTCPISGKPVTELTEPVRCVECKHIYEKKAVMIHIKSNSRAKCPITGCPRILQANKVICDPLLLAEIEEMRSISKQTTMTNVIEDFTELDGEGSD